MADAKQVFEQMRRDLDLVMREVEQGLTWHPIEPPDENSKAYDATGSCFKIVCVSMDRPQKHFDGLVTMLGSSITIIHLPPAMAKTVFERIARSLN